VLPGGEDELTKLTFAILDYAVNVPAQPVVLTKQVTYNIGADGMPTADKTKTVGTVSGTLPIDAPGMTLLKAGITHAADALEAQIIAAKAEADRDPNHPRMAQLKATMARTDELTALRQRAASIPNPPSLPAPYYPSIDTIGGANLLQVQGRLQAVQPVPPLVLPPS
jgi:hypothetical protein